MMEDAVLKDAEMAIETCHLRKYISIHDQTIYKKLLECYVDAMRGKDIDRLVFIGDSLEVANNVVHLGTSRADYYAGVRWVDKTYPDSDARAVLAALTLIYILKSTDSEKGAKSLKLAGDDINEMRDESNKIDPVSIWPHLRGIVEDVISNSRGPRTVPDK